MEMRLQRFLSQAGVASRRKAEQLIVDGKVKVNGRAATELGTKVDPDRDKVIVDGRRILAARTEYLLFCKPRGYVTTLSDPEGRPTVMTLLGDRARGLYPVGRLDFLTDGILLLTNDGDLAHALMHPSGGIEKTYHAKVQGLLTDELLQQLREGVTLDDGTKTRPAEVHTITRTDKHTWLQITIKEGKNRQIHRMCEGVGHAVLKLSRVGYGPLSSSGLKPGEARELTDGELAALRELAKKAMPRHPIIARKRAPPKRRR